MNTFYTCVAAAMALASVLSAANAGTLGPLEYEVEGGFVTITDCDTAVTDVVIPSLIEGLPVKIIGSYAFSDCVAMTNVTLPSGVSRLDDGAFNRCESLLEISLPNTVTNLGDHAFYGCDALWSASLSSSIADIGDGTFYACKSLTDVTIPAAVTNVGVNAFMICPELNTVRFLGDGPVSLGRSAFSIVGDEFMIYFPRESMEFPTPTWNGYPTSPWIYTYEVQNESITITDCDDTAADRVFIPAVVDGRPVMSIAADAFLGLDSMKEVILPSMIEEIGARAFAGCDALTGIRLPASLSNLGSQAFQDCIALEEANFMGPAPTSFGLDVFVGTASNFTIHYQGVSSGFTTPVWQGYSAFSWFLDYEVDGDFVEITDCDTNAVGGVSIPATIEGKSVVSVGRHAFSGCRFMDDVEIPSSVTNLDVGAFIYCELLTNVVIPSSVVKIGDGAFFDCRELLSIEVDPGNTSYESVNGVLFSADLNELVFYPNGLSGRYAIPSGVANVGDSAFAGCDTLTEVNFPASVTNIGNSAFGECDGLTRIELPSSVVQIGPYAFAYCDALSTVSLSEGINTIEMYAFWHCPALTSISVPASVSFFNPTAINKSPNISTIHVALGNAHYSSLDSVLFNADQTEIIRVPEGRSGVCTIPEGVTLIENYEVFGECNRLTRVGIPSTLPDIGSFTFGGCDALTHIDVAAGNATYASIDGVVFSADKKKLLKFPRGRRGVYTIPDGVEWLNGFSFRNCDSLYGVVLATDVETIDSLAFSGCSSLRVATFLCDAPRFFQSSTFSYAAEEFEVRYLSGTTGFSAPMWNGYPAMEMGAEEYAFSTWLLAHGFALDADLTMDQNGDGVAPLMAYALDLDPALDLSGSALNVETDPSGMRMTYHAARPEITYLVETSEDLKTWTTTGVSVSDLDLENQCTATIDLTAPHRFLRLRVAK